MHHNSIIVALTNDEKKPYREFNYKKLHDKCKTSEVILPFDTDYQILVKNENSSRILLHIDVDGTIISGDGLVVNGKSQTHIERFLDIAKKLHFTKKTNEKVADPSNEENGFLTIKVVKEKYVPYTFVKVPDVVWHYPDPSYYDLQPRWLVDPMYGSGNPPTHTYGLKASDVPNGGYCTTSRSLSGITSMNASLSTNTGSGIGSASANCFHSSIVPCSANLSSDKLDVGATVEGGKSDQSFVTTSWAGDEVGSDYIFRFKMLGKEVKLNPQEEKDLMEYKRLKAKFEGI